MATQPLPQLIKLPPGYESLVDPSTLGIDTKAIKLPKSIKLPPGYENLVDPSTLQKPDPSQIQPQTTFPKYPSITMPGDESEVGPTVPWHHIDPAVLASTLPAIGAATGGYFSGGLGTGAGAGLGSAVLMELRNEFPNLFGNAPKSSTGMGVQLGSDILTNSVIPAGINALINPEARAVALAKIVANSPLKNFPAVREGMARSISQGILNRYQYPQTAIIESAAANAADTADSLTAAIKSGDKTALQESQDIFGENRVGNSLLNLQRQVEAGQGVAGNQATESIAKDALSSVQQARNFKLSTREPITLQQLAVSNLFTDAFKASTGTINGAGILDILGGSAKEIYQEAISDPKVYQNVQDAATELMNQEKTGVTDRIINWSAGHIMWSLSGGGGVGGIVGGLLGGREGAELGIGTAGIAAAGITLTNKELGKIMSDPHLSSLVVQAMKTSINAPEAGLITQALQAGIKAAGIDVSAQSALQKPKATSSAPQ